MTLRDKTTAEMVGTRPHRVVRAHPAGHSQLFRIFHSGAGRVGAPLRRIPDGLIGSGRAGGGRDRIQDMPRSFLRARHGRWRTEPLLHRSDNEYHKENEPSHRRSAFATMVKSGHFI